MITLRSHCRFDGIESFLFYLGVIFSPPQFRDILLVFLVFLTGLGFSEVRINELMASNVRSFPDIVDFEDYPDWLELFNDGAEEVDLSGYYLSDDPSEPQKWAIPPGTRIPGNGYLLIMADGYDAEIGDVHPRGYWPWRAFVNERLHTNFSLSSAGETLSLYRSEGAMNETFISLGSTWKYLDDRSPQDDAWKQKDYDDHSWASGAAPLGYGDDPATAIRSRNAANEKQITSYFRQSFSVDDPSHFTELTLKMQVDDAAVVFLNGSELTRYNLPDGPITSETPALRIAAAAEEGIFQDITLSSDALVMGENVITVEVHQGAFGIEDMRFDLRLRGVAPGLPLLLDSLTFPQQLRDVSIGRDPAQASRLLQFAGGTPGGPNLSPSAPIISDLRAESPEVSFAPAAGLYPSSQVITLTSGAGDIYYSTDGSTPNPSSTLYEGPFEVSETTVLRARCFAPGQVPSSIATQTYFIGETFKNLPFVSVSADPETLFGERIGIYLNSHEPNKNVYKGKDAPGHLEFFPNDGSAGFSVNAGIRIGGENNWASHAQKALNFALRGKFGDDLIHYDLFPGSGIPRHSGIALREGGDDWKNAMLRDSLWWYLAGNDELKVDTSARRPVVSFINGEYWGIYNLRDRWNEQWFHEHYGVDDGNYDHLGYGHFTSSATTLGAHHGDISEWNEFLENFIQVEDLTDPENWAYLESQIDLDSYIDFIICESYGGNTSWRHNREFWKERKAGAKWRWFIPDMDRTWQNPENNVFANMLRQSVLLHSLHQVPAFRARLAQRFSAQIGSTLRASRIQDLLDTLGPLLEPELERHVDRWNAAGTTLPRYASEIQKIRSFANARKPVVMEQIRQGLALDPAVSISLGSLEKGSLKIAGVTMTDSALTLFPGLETSIEAIPAPGFTFSHWSGISGPASTTFEAHSGLSIQAHFLPSQATILSGTLNSDTTWSLAGSPYVIQDDLLIPHGVTLRIEKGVLVEMEANQHFRILGTLLINGSEAQPITFRGRNGQTWGGLSFEEPSSPSILNHLRIHDASRGKDPTHYPSAISGLNATIEMNFIHISESRAPLFFRGGSMILRDSFIHIPVTGDGLNVKQGKALTERCTFLGNRSPDTDAIDYDGVIDGIIRDCRIYRFFGFNSDGIDTGEQCQNILIEGNRLFFNSDKGVSVGQGSTVIMRKNLIVGCAQGVGVKDRGSSVIIDQNTFVDCPEGVSVFEKNFGAGGGFASVSNSIFSRCAQPISTDSLSLIDLHYSLSDTLALPGNGNIQTDPQFTDPLRHDFSLRPSSPAINSGDPDHPRDPDGSLIDLGADYRFDPLDYPFEQSNTIVINEILANSAEGEDWIELHNRTNSEIDIGGWFLSDDGSNLMKYRIPEGSTIAPGGYQVFFEDLNFGSNSEDPNALTPFALSRAGETLHLSSAANDTLSGYRFSEDYGASEPGETIGYSFKPSTETYQFVRLQASTMGSKNAPALSGPIVISEIMYHVAGDEDAEYLELFNLSEHAVSLFNSHFNRGWKLDQGIDFEFPATSSIAPGERIIITRDVAAFTAQFNPPLGTQIFSWSEGRLSNSGDRIELERPGLIDDLGQTKFIRIDQVNYGTLAPWPPEADGTGLSLVKINTQTYGDDATNWTALPPSPGRATSGQGFETWANGLQESDDADGDGRSNLLEYALGSDPQSHNASPPLGFNLQREQIALSLELPLDRSDVQVTVQRSSDLRTWTPLELPPIHRGQSRLQMSATFPKKSHQTGEYYRVFVRRIP